MATGRKTVVVGQVIDPVAWGNPLWDQSVQTFASAADRTAQFPAPKQGATTWLEDVKSLEVYDGVAWRSVRRAGTTPPARAVTTAPTLAPGVWADMVAVPAYPVIAGESYLVTAFGAVLIGGAKALISQQLYLGTVTSGGAAFDGIVAEVIPLAASAILVAAVTGDVKVTWQGFTQAPATGLAVAAGTNLSVGRFG